MAVGEQLRYSAHYAKSFTPEGMHFSLGAQRKAEGGKQTQKGLSVLCVSNEHSEWAVNFQL